MNTSEQRSARKLELSIEDRHRIETEVINLTSGYSRENHNAYMLCIKAAEYATLYERSKGQPDELSKAQERIRELDRMLEQFVYYGTIHTVRGVVPADFNSHEGLITLAKNYLQNK